MKPLTEQELLWRKNDLTIEDAAMLLTGERHSSAWQVAKSELTNAIHAKKLRTFYGYSGAAPPYARLELIRMSDFKKFFQSISAEIEQATTAVPAKLEKLVLKSQQQDKAILNWLKENGYDPQKLPAPPKGKAGVKKDCRDALCSNKNMFSSESVFKTAWDRLRASGEIKDAK